MRKIAAKRRNTRGERGNAQGDRGLSDAIFITICQRNGLSLFSLNRAGWVAGEIPRTMGFNETGRQGSAGEVPCTYLVEWPVERKGSHGLVRATVQTIFHRR